MDKQKHVRGMTYEQFQIQLIEILESIDPEKPDSPYLGALETLLEGAPGDFKSGSITTVAIRRRIIYGSFTNLLTQMMLEDDVRTLSSELGIEHARGLERIAAEDLITQWIWKHWAEIVYCNNLVDDGLLNRPTVDGVEKIMSGTHSRFQRAMNTYIKAKKLEARYPYLRGEISADKRDRGNVVNESFYHSEEEKKSSGKS
ncbi:MAG: hypothetical protein MUO40_08250 [Anaerolineaceae bacterium]|nr:hypothetical protein [Anaerolineaceae bacterium]